MGVGARKLGTDTSRPLGARPSGRDACVSPGGFAGCRRDQEGSHGIRDNSEAGILPANRRLEACVELPRICGHVRTSYI